MVTTKWGGAPHYAGDVQHLGDDEHGSWLWRPQGTPIHRGDDHVFDTSFPSIHLVVPGAWWSPSWWFGHPEVEVYVNIGTPFERVSDNWLGIDLDLDVIRWTDGRVEVVDRDELEEHRVLYAYPDDVVASVEEHTARAYDLVVANTPPFDGAAARAWRPAAES